MAEREQIPVDSDSASQAETASSMSDEVRSTGDLPDLDISADDIVEALDRERDRRWPDDAPAWEAELEASEPAVDH